MKQKLIRLAAALLCVLLLAVCSFSAFAAGPVDLSRRCSVTFRVVSFYRPVPGGNILLTKVATIGGNGYVWIPELYDYPLKPIEVDDFEKCAELYAYVQTKNLPKQERIINDRGEASFTNLEPAIYLYYQTIPASGYTTLAPYMFMLPQYEDGQWNYDPVAYPKPSIKPTPGTTNPTAPTPPVTTPTSPTTPTTPTSPSDPYTTYPVDTTNPTTPTTPTNPTNPTNPTRPTSPTEPTEPTGTTGPSEPTGTTAPGEPTKPDKPTKPEKPTKPGETTTVPDHSKTEPRTTTEKPEELPKTGQLKWPVPVLAGLGLVLLAFGALLRMLDRRDDEEEEP